MLRALGGALSEGKPAATPRYAEIAQHQQERDVMSRVGERHVLAISLVRVFLSRIVSAQDVNALIIGNNYAGFAGSETLQADVCILLLGKYYCHDLGNPDADMQIAMYRPDRGAPLPPLCYKQLGQFVHLGRLSAQLQLVGQTSHPTCVQPPPKPQEVRYERSPSPGVSYSVYKIPLPDAPSQPQSIPAPALTDPPELPRRSSRRRRQPTRLDL
ncbi:hypothetical protein BgiBS90_024830 [Biomphalaria glabrata]|nr:hypothetical protein BgiBS90_024830 [Biomphalaria glabrata]